MLTLRWFALVVVIAWVPGLRADSITLLVSHSH